jgi:hypothetical protein
MTISIADIRRVFVDSSAWIDLMNRNDQKEQTLEEGTSHPHRLTNVTTVAPRFIVGVAGEYTT